MKVATFSIGGERRVGIVDLDRADRRCRSTFPSRKRPKGVLALIERNGAGLPRTSAPLPLERVALEAPIPRPRRNIFCVGKNYHEHAHEFAAQRLRFQRRAPARCRSTRSSSPRCRRRVVADAADGAASTQPCRRRSTTRPSSR